MVYQQHRELKLEVSCGEREENMVMRMRKGGRSAGKAAICLGAVILVKLAADVIPILQGMEIGENVRTSENDAVTLKSAGCIEEKIGCNMAEGIGISPEQNTYVSENAEASLISWESDDSKAMWQSKLYSYSQNGDDGKIVEKHYGTQAGTQILNLDQCGQVRNCTFWNNSDLLTESRILPDLPLKLDGTPMVLIYHTHTTESFLFDEQSNYDASFNFRTTEPDKNMVMVGDAIAKKLADSGIGVIHACEIHDFPVWNNSYSRSAKTVKSILEKYPSICIALDVHRDAISTNSTIYAPICTINGKKSAQIMLISGCDNGTMNLPNYRENFHFASFLQQSAEKMYRGFTRPVLFDYRKYNQDLTNGSLLVEFGSQGNTLEEVRYAGELFGSALAQTIRELASQQAKEQS